MTKLLINLFVKNSDDIKDKIVRKSYGNLGGLVGIACNLILFTIKLIAGILSGSIAITADAFKVSVQLGATAASTTTV